MENSTIALVVFSVSVGLMAAVFIYVMVRDFCGEGIPASELCNLHLAPPPPPTSTRQSKTSTSTDDGSPWFLVVYDEDFKVSLTLAADEILCFIRPRDGEIRIQCKHMICGTSTDEIWLEDQFKYKFLPASRLGDVLVDVEEEDNGN